MMVKENDKGQGDLDLVQRALSGDRQARSQVNVLVHPIIDFQSDRFCKRFCADNRYHYRCTLSKPWGSAGQDALLCEWGNACYGWMLDELAGEKRLRNYRGERGAGLYEYMFSIANSLPFYERWKNWRFGRRAYAPSYIRALNENADRVFFALKDGYSIEVIAQQLGLVEEDVDRLAQTIVVTLTQRGKLHLLENERAVSLDRQDDDDEAPGVMNRIELASRDPDPELMENTQRVRQAWSKLSAVEQFILEAMLIEEQDANDVLFALKEMNICLNEKKPNEEVDRQQLYYFRRKTIVKLSRLVGLH